MHRQTHNLMASPALSGYASMVEACVEEVHVVFDRFSAQAM